MKLSFLLIAALIISAACTRENTEIEMNTGKVKVKVNLTTNNLSTKATTSTGGAPAIGYKRGTAPEFISGVKFKVENTEYPDDKEIYEEEYTFGTGADTDQDIILSKIAVGTNKITAVSVHKDGDAAYVQNIQTNGKTLQSFPADISTVTSDQLNKYAEATRTYVDTYATPYFEFSAEKEVDIYPHFTSEGMYETQTVDMNMQTKNHRLIIALAIPDHSKYNVAMKVTATIENGSKIVYFEDAGDGTPVLTKIGNTAFWVLNTIAQKGNVDYDIDFTTYTKTSNQVVNSFGKIISLSAGDNLSKYYIFNDNELYESDIDANNITWQDVTGDNQGEILQPIQ